MRLTRKISLGSKIATNKPRLIQANICNKLDVVLGNDLVELINGQHHCIFGEGSSLEIDVDLMRRTGGSKVEVEGVSLLIVSEEGSEGREGCG